MNRWRAYIKPFGEDGEYVDEYIEVTDDVVWTTLGSIQKGLDNTDYDIGVYRNSNFNVSLRNDHGRYSDVERLQSIFRHTRSNSLFKITWELNEDDSPICGLPETLCGEVYLSEEMTIFEGLLNDESLAMDLTKQEVTFQVLGRESTFDREVVPFADIANDELASSIIYKCLNQSRITALLSIDPGDISLGNDQELDAVADLENKTVQEALADLLFITSSVLYVDSDGAIHVTPREPTAALQYTFYGQASNIGPENIQDIQKIKNGLAKVFNFMVWRETSVLSEDDTSIETYGVRKKEVDFTYFTDSVKQQSLLDSITEEFAVPKREFDLYTPVNYETLEIDLLDRVACDYPTVYTSTDPLPILGVAVLGEAILPKGVWSFSLTTGEEFKIMERSLDIRNGLFKFRMREV